VIIGSLSAIDRNHCPPSIGTSVRNRRNPHTILRCCRGGDTSRARTVVRMRGVAKPWSGTKTGGAPFRPMDRPVESGLCAIRGNLLLKKADMPRRSGV
jgi:hypothetical protein